MRSGFWILITVLTLAGRPASAAESKHWAYVKPVRSALPVVRDANWPRNAIDHFVLAPLDVEALKPSPEADRATLIRRLSLDLLGLPPTLSEVDGFLNNNSPDAYERLVDRLLASPHFGVRWARPWLDLARYADSHGFQRDDRVPLGGGASLTKTGTGDVTLTAANTYTGGTTVHAGTLRVNRLHENNAIAINAGKIQIMESAPGLGSGHPSGSNASVSRPLSLNIAPGGTLDLTNNDLILDYGGASPITAYEALVAFGYNVTGDWQGDGITSSVAAVAGNYVLAIADNASLAAPFGTAQGGPLFAGVDVDLDTILIKFTHRADINLDGVVTPDDSAVFGGSYDESITSGFTWAQGDMNYDGACTTDDAAIFGGAYDESLASLPEPGSLGLLAVCTLGLARRRRRLHPV